jgi:hypothetical protein
MAKLAVVPKRQHEATPDISFRSYDRIEPGEYPGYCKSAAIYLDTHWRRWVCATQWDIVDDGSVNVIAHITKFFNLGPGKNPRATSRRSNYWRAWIDANSGQQPVRGQKMSPAIFVRRFARVEVADVEKDFNGMALSDDEVYSTIRKIICWETGDRAGINNQ